MSRLHRSVGILITFILLAALAPILSVDAVPVCSPINSTHNSCTESYGVPTDEEDVSKNINFGWVNDAFRLEYKGRSISIEPLVIYAGQERNLEDIRNSFPNVELKDHITKAQFFNKFAFNFSNIPPQMAGNIDFFVFRLVDSEGISWSDIKVESSSLLIKEKVRIDFSDLERNGYNLYLVNRTYLVIGNVSQNYKNNGFYLDPVVTLDSSDVEWWGDVVTGGRAATKYGFHISWDITDIPAGVTSIDSSFTCFKDTCSQFCLGMPDNDINLSRYDDQVLGFGAWNQLTANITNNTAETWVNISGGATLTNGNWWCHDDVDKLIDDYNLGNTYTRERYIDPDFSFLNISSSVAKDGNLFFGGFGFTILFASPSFGTPASRPFKNITYTAEGINPTVNLLYPTQDFNIPPIPQTENNFTCEVNDTSTIANVTLFSSFRNGSFIKEVVDTSGGNPANYTFFQNFTDWWDSGSHFVTNNLSSSNGRSLTRNSSGFWISSAYGDDDTKFYHPNGTFERNMSNPDAWVGDIDTNDTHLVMVDIVAKKLYVVNSSNHVTNGGGLGCSVTTLSTGFPYGVAFDDDNTTFWVLFDNVVPEHISHTNHLCHDLLRDINILTPSAPTAGMTIHNNISVFFDTFGADKVTAMNLTDGTNPYNISNIDQIMDASGNSYGGIFIAPEDIEPNERLYFTMNSPQQYSFLQRYYDETGILYNCLACDVFSNCGYALVNKSFNVRNFTPPILPPINITFPDDKVVRDRIDRNKYIRESFIYLPYFILILLAWFIIRVGENGRKSRR